MKRVFKKKNKKGKDESSSQEEEVQQVVVQPVPVVVEAPASEEKDDDVVQQQDSTSTSTSALFEYTVHDDLYGQVIPKETPELLSSKLQELEQELQNITNNNDDKKAWLMALEKCPTLSSSSSFQLMFLRCEIFNVQLAAKRILKYWKKRLDLFGEIKAFLPFILGKDGPFQDDDVALQQIGFLRSTNQKDNAGRPILFADPSRLPMDQSTYENESVCRSVWYYTHAILEKDEVAQRKGVVIVGFPKYVKFAQFNRKLAKMNADSLKGCIPVRLSALHICHPPTRFFDIIFPIIKILMGAQLRKKIKVNTGSDEKVLEKFERKFGITRDKLPTEMGGGLVLDHEKWLEERLQNGY